MYIQWVYMSTNSNCRSYILTVNKALWIQRLFYFERPIFLGKLRTNCKCSELISVTNCIKQNTCVEKIITKKKIQFAEEFFTNETIYRSVYVISSLKGRDCLTMTFVPVDIRSSEGSHSKEETWPHVKSKIISLTSWCLLKIFNCSWSVWLKIKYAWKDLLLWKI